ncbi:MAG: tetratricopeptide repeat protein [Coraliomargarita sp.]
MRWGRLLAAFCALGVALWLTLTAGLYILYKYKKEYDAISYTDVLLFPVKRAEIREKMGNYHVKTGIQLLNEGEVRDGLRLIRLGVARAPSNLEGRLIVAALFESALKRPDRAADMLLQGLEYGGIDDTPYLKQTLQLLLRHQMDSAIQDLADQHLPPEPELSDRNRLLAFGAANANYLRGNYDRADDYILSYNMTDTREGVLLSAQISWDRGNKVAAITKMEQSLNKFPGSEALLMQLSRYNRELGKIEEARQYAILRNVAAPLSSAPRIELLYIYNKTGDNDREKRETKNMLKQFRDDEQALQALANFGADTGNIELTRRTYEEALENEFDIDSFALLLIEAHLVSKDYNGALDFAEELIKENPEWLTKRRAIFQSLRAVASYGINRPDEGQIYLQDFVNEVGTPPQTYLAVARRFSMIDRAPQARKILSAAYQLAPSNQKILSELIRVELELGYTEDLNRLLTRFLQMRRPQVDLLVEAYRKLGSDRFIFTPDRESLLLELSALLRENAQTSDLMNEQS